MEVVLLAALMSTSACTSTGASTSTERDVVQSSTASLEFGADTDVSTWHESWEAAAIAEAQRLHPGEDDLSARVVYIDGMGERVEVEGANDCWLYGGLWVKDRWRANEIGEC